MPALRRRRPILGLHSAGQAGFQLPRLRRQGRRYRSDAVSRRLRFCARGRDADRRGAAEPKPNGHGDKLGKAIAEYSYMDEAGELLFQVVRFDPKTFRQRRPDGHGHWTWNVTGVRMVPYRLPELLEAIASEHPVVIVEGEKDVRTAVQLGLVATTNAGGAGKWRDEYDQYFTDADVIIVPDNDASRHGARADCRRTSAESRKACSHGELTRQGSDRLGPARRNARAIRQACRGARAGKPQHRVALPPGRRPGADGMADQIHPAGDRRWPDLRPVGHLQNDGGARHRGQRHDQHACSPGATGSNGRVASPILRLRASVALPRASPPLLAPTDTHSRCPLCTDRIVPRSPPQTRSASSPPWSSSSASLLRDKFDVPLVLAFVDTVVVAAGYSKSGDDNDAAIAQRIMSVLSQLSQQTGMLVVGIDHFGKVTETGTRGSSAKEGHADAVLALLADRELNGTLSNTRLAVRKQREGIAGLELAFTPTTVEVGTDPDGDPITRMVIDWAAAPEQPAAKGWSKSLQLLRRILMTLLVDGKDITPFLDGPIVRACDIELVRAEFYRQYPAEGDPQEGRGAPQGVWTRAQERTGQHPDHAAGDRRDAIRLAGQK